MSHYQPFTLDDGLTIQRQHLAEWECLLKPHFYQQLVDEVERANRILMRDPDIVTIDPNQLGYYVVRGDSLAHIVHNLPKHPPTTSPDSPQG
jgi:hypothetical protein